MHELFDKIINNLSVFKYNILIAGFFGGAVYVAFTNNLTRLQSFTSIIIGVLTAYYLTPLVVAYTAKYTGIIFNTEMEGGVGFILGLSALYLIPAIFRKINKAGV